MERIEDKKTLQPEQRSHQMRDRIRIGRGRGRSSVGEAAKGVGLMSEQKSNYGRY